jgi:Protein O-mannosyl-transferase TMEM260-like
MDFRKLNNITGWLVFLVALITYVITIEDTASFWDVGEFTAVSYKLMVPHPPGAPFFLLLGRMASFLSLGDVYQVAYWVNMVSVVASAFTILFMFWSITLISRKLLKTNGNISSEQTIAILGSGLIGSLVYTFSDTFWFSAVEAEVYAMSSFLTAFVVWAMLKWELIDDESRANRWLILIAYVFGISIGIHLLNLVAIPVLGLIYYFKKHPQITRNGIIFTLIASLIIVIIINYGIIPGLPQIAGKLEILFVNSFGLPFGSAIVFLVLLVVGGLVYSIIYTHKKAKVILNTGLLSLAFIIIGYSSYTLVVIRSAYNPPIDENNPEDVMSMVSYLLREQYGSRPLLYGQYFTAETVDQYQGAPVYVKGKDKYIVADYKLVNKYDPKQMTILPRMWSGSHASTYREIMNLKPGEKPTFIDNIAYMFKRQMGHMYWRYFMWNFSGRESDIQDASWLSPMDAFADTPESIKSNRGRNNYFMLPLLLGIIGMIFSYYKDPKQFFVILALFFLTGLALIIYLNSPPTEPRERDYIYVGSYYAFAFYIGFGVLGIITMLSRLMKPALAGMVAITISLTAPIVMASENWDDHDRSDRYFSVDSAKNFLASCAPNAILFTGGDNDTFPLWYVQEVEGFRTDVRVVVLSYFNTDWYIDQMTRAAYKSAPFPFSLSKEDYRQGGLNDFLLYDPNSGIKGAISLKQYLKLLRDNNPQLRYDGRAGSSHIVPSKHMFLDVDTTSVLSMGIIPENMKSMLVSRMQWSMKKSYLEKKDLMALDLIATNNWERPIYFNNTSRQGIGLDFGKYLVQEGNAFRLLPVNNPNKDVAMVNTDLMYDNLMHNFFYRELANPKVYYNEDYRKFALNQRAGFNTLTAALINEGNDERAREVALKGLELMPDISLPYDYTSSTTIEYLMAVGEKDRAIAMAKVLGARADEKVGYYLKNDNNISFELQQNLVILRDLAQSMGRFGELELAKQFGDALEGYYDELQIGGGGRSTR